jgi:hypothetical protein
MAKLSRLADWLNEPERDTLAGCAGVLARLTEIAAAGDAS